MPTIAIVGAGPGMGLAIARTFGSRGFDVALISRSRERLDRLVEALAGEGVTARAFPASVLDRDALTTALDDAAAHFGGIDVLEWSPAVHSPADGLKMVSPSAVTVEDLRPEIEFNLYGAVTAARAVLPAMRDAGAGTLFFTNGAGSVDPNPVLGNINAASGALRNWAINLHKELRPAGIYVAHVAIGVWIGGDGPEGSPTATAEQIAPVYWDLYSARDVAEHVFTG